MTADPAAALTVLLAMTGLTQTDAAALLGVASRTVRRWMEGDRVPPVTAIDRLEALARDLDKAAASVVRAVGERRSAPAVFVVYRRDEDLPPWTRLRTAGCHLAVIRRIVERRPDVQLVIYRCGAYRRWLGSRPDSKEMRAAWAASRLTARQANV
jgi:transcriptional regulator with XRE-family HTH domain